MSQTKKVFLFGVMTLMAILVFWGFADLFHPIFSATFAEGVASILTLLITLGSTTLSILLVVVVAETYESKYMGFLFATEERIGNTLIGIFAIGVALLYLEVLFLLALYIFAVLFHLRKGYVMSTYFKLYD